jgi:hypothetical protein
MVEIHEEHREGVLGISPRPFPCVPKALDETDPIGEAGESIVQRIVTELPLDSFRLNRAALELDLGDR